MRPCCAVPIFNSCNSTASSGHGGRIWNGEKKGENNEKEESVKQKTTEGGAQRTITGDKLGS